MRKNRASKSPQSGPLLKSWRQEGPTGGRAKAWLIVRRATATLVALTLVGWLSWLLLSPLFLPKTYFSFVAADDLQPLAAPPLRFVYEDLSGFARLQDSLTPLSLEAPPLPFTRLARPELLEAELEAIGEADIGPSDAVILYIAAHGLVLDRGEGPQAYLACSNFSPGAAGSQIEQGLYPVKKLLGQLRDLPGGPKLLLLDAGQLEQAPRAGMAINLFPEMLQQAVGELEQATPTLWVFTANSPGERSHVSAALRRSVFGYLAAAGLQGAADLNSDDEIHLGELAEYVRQNVARWVQQATGDRASQTPLLLGPPRTGEEVHLLYTAGLPAVASISAEMNAAHSEGSRKSVLANVADFMSERVDEFAVGPASDAFDFLTSGFEEESDEPSEGDEGASGADAATDRDAARREAEYRLVERAWELTAQLAADPRPPIEYAPHLWRLHLDQLLWYEQLQQSGERLDPRILVEQLRQLNQSLEDFNQPDKPLRGAPRNVVEQIRLRRPLPPVSLAEAPTLALAEVAAAADPRQALPEKLAAFVEQYDRWLESADGYDQLAALVERAWGDPLWKASWRQFYEFLPIQDYLDRPELPTNLVKLSLSVRRQGERLAARRSWGQGWAADNVEHADRQRLEAERLLLDQAASDWEARVEEGFREARRLYAEADSQLEEVDQATRLEQRMLSLASDYLRWRRHAGRQSATSAPSEQRLRDLLVVLEQLGKVLDRPREANLADLRSYASRLEGIRDDLAARHLPRIIEELATAPFRSNVPPRIEAILQTALLGAEARSRLIAARVAAEQALMREFEMSESTAAALEPPSPRASRQAAANHLEMWQALLQKFDPRASESTTISSATNVDDLDAIVQQNNALQEQLTTLPDAVLSIVDDNRALANPDGRKAQLERLRRASRALYLIDPVDLRPDSPLVSGPFSSEAAATNNGVAAGGNDPVQAIHRAEWYDTLRLGHDRRRRAIADAPPRQASALRSQARRLGELAMQIEGQPPLPPDRPATLRLNVAQTEVPLVTADETVVNLTVHSQQETPVWIVAQYDEQILEVDGVGGIQVVRENQMPAPPPSVDPADAGYPYQPQVRGLTDSFEAAARQPRDVSVRVRRRSAAGGKATLVLKAVSQNEHVRQELPVRLPGRRELELSVLDARGQEKAVDTSVNLFARHIQDLTLQIANRGGAQRTLRAGLYAPQRRSAVEIPEGWIEPLAAEQILRRFGRRVPVATGATLVVPPGASRPLVFDFGSTDNRSALGAQTEGAPPRIPIPYGILLQLVDQDSGESTIWPLQFEVWKPRRFLTARAFYDPGSQELRVALEPIDATRLPAAPVKAELIIDPQYVSDVGRRAMSAEISGPGQRGELRAPLKGFWPQEGYLSADVRVDGYPRAFRFRVNPATAGQDLWPEEDVTQIEIASPAPGAEFPASPQVPVELRVDAPEGFFSVEASWIDVGIDVDRDREFQNENPRRLRSDRHVEIFARIPTGEETTLALEPIVRDFELSMNTEGLNGRVNVLCQVQADGVIEEEQDVEIVLDGDGPTFAPFKFNDVDGDLVAEIYPQDELTRVVAVEAGLESLDTKEIKWEKAKPGAAGDQWIARLSLKELSPGEHNVHFRAVDAAGNASLAKREVTVERESTPPTDSAGSGSQASESKPPQPVENRLRGVVTYGRHEISELVVTLAGQDKTARVSAGGRFDFGNLAPGDYTIQARGLSRGNYRKGEKKVTVSDQPNRPVNVQLKIR